MGLKRWMERRKAAKQEKAMAGQTKAMEQRAATEQAERQKRTSGALDRAILAASDALRSAESVEGLAMKLDPALDAGITAIRTGDVRAFGAALNAYGDALRDADLELEATRRDREALARVPGVVGVKGAGALQADALVVALSPEASADRAARDALIAAATRRGLTLVCDGITHEAGVQHR